MNDCVVINFSNGGWYRKGQDRLKLSLKNNTKARILTFSTYDGINSPLHSINPYAFKVYAFKKAKESGFKKILYLDASVWAIKNIDCIFEIISNNGYIMQKAGQNVGTWANDRCLSYFGLSRDDAMIMPMYGNAGFLGLNFDFKVANDFFNKWQAAMLDNIFIGLWNNTNKTESKDDRCKGHRHDMVCGSIIANQLNMKYAPAINYLQYVKNTHDLPINDTICFYAQGM